MSEASGSQAWGTPYAPSTTPPPPSGTPPAPGNQQQGQTQQGPAQQGEPPAQSQQPPAQADCPDPSPPYIEYQVDAAATKKESDLYAADAAAVAKDYAALDGAQSAYTKAKDERKSAFDDLTTRLGRIQENLDCVLDKATRDRLTKCWQDIVEQSAATPPPKCDDVDTWDCAKLPTDIATLRSWTARAAACVARVDADFDRLANLPKTIGGRVTDLAGRATRLEAEVCGPRTDPERSYVEGLQLNQEFQLLATDWIEPTAYVCALRKLFVTLVKRHTISICVQVAVLRWDKRKELEEAAKGAKAKNLVDLVLECSRQPEDGTYATSNGGAQAPDEPEATTTA